MKYDHIKQAVYRKIESGEWPEHHPVSSENQLAKEFQVSRMTARRALQELSDEGLVVRTRGAGTFVAPLKSQSALLTIRNIADEIRLRKHRHHAVVRLLEEVDAEPGLATLFGLQQGAKVWHSVITHFENGHAVQVEDRHINPALVPHYLEQDFTLRTPHEYLCEVTPLTEASHQIEAVSPTSMQQQWLDLDQAEPCLQIQRRTWAREGMVSQAVLTHPGSRFRLGGHMTFSQKAKVLKTQTKK
ncbi:histidine utilization repressor [Aliidiomarina sedimenti]|uniref:Histidine utilization repressor n=2 Tax=Aliidiomarina TaxID=1249554 RepID=A0A432WF23_9GAMM|nr:MULTISPECIES: histidine utilization repressor [Aliidiomarina]RUO29201.1 histidine utilization repressor [Aliidiomarina sedimenti]RUO32383.1 histidine utilization repressor [Aliidiomarina soli]